MTFTEKRSEARIEYQAELTVALLDSTHYRKATTRNFSNGGLVMETGAVFDPGVRLHLRMDRHMPQSQGPEAYRYYIAEVKSCRLIYGGKVKRYSVGVALLEKMNTDLIRPAIDPAAKTSPIVLRRKAEQYLADQPEIERQIPDTDMREILHELHVHQIELGMQNDELRHARDDTAKALSKYADLYDFAPVGYFTFDPNGLILEVNLTGAGLLQIERSRLIGKPFTNFVDRNDEDVFWMHRHGAKASHPPQKDEIRLIRKDGNLIHVRLESTLVPCPEDALNKVFTVVSDISARKLAAKQRRMLEERLVEAQKMEAIGALAGGVAHDFNNLLMAIQGSVSLMRIDLSSNHPLNVHLDRMEEMINSATDLTKQLLGFARGGKYHVRPIDLNSLIQTSVELFARTRRDIDVETNLQDDHATVAADRSQLEQVFMNLFINAHHSMPRGGRLKIGTTGVDLKDAQLQSRNLPAGRYVRITVTDTGVGMDARTRRRIFEPFFTTKDLGMGTGLGLASVYGIITNHQGFIEVMSKPLAGTTFIIYLPVTREKAQVDSKRKHALREGNETVMLVDDELQIRQVVCKMLERLGYQVLLAVSGEEAIERYDPASIDLVILDMTMPGMDGGQTFEQLHELDPDVKVLLASGYSQKGQAEDIVKNGCKGFIQKPFSLKKLSGTMRMILDE